MKILFLTTVLPSARRSGGEIASQYFIDGLEKSGHEVLVLGYQRQGDTFNKQRHELAVAHRYIETNKSGLLRPLLWMGSAWLRNMSFSCAKYYSQEYLQKLQQILHSQAFDLIIFDHAQIGWLVNCLENAIAHRPKVIFIAHNVEHQMYCAQSETANSYVSKYMYQRESELIKKCEDNLAKIADRVWTFTEHDSNYFRSINPHTQVFDLPSSLKTLTSQSTEKNYDVGIIGTWTWKANRQGLIWFFQTVYPYLPKNLSIHVAGKGAEDLFTNYPNVKYCGFVADAQQFMSAAKVIAIPSISGGGVQIKTLDAIASGVPVVATPIALRGVSKFPASVQIAEQPEEFAHRLSEILAVNTNSQQDITQLFQERLIWSQNRQQRFSQDIFQALHSLHQ